jgi:hypothetical protein
MKFTLKNFVALVTTFLSVMMIGQPVPAADENIPFLVTFGNEAGSKWGDDDNSQTFFFKVKKEFKEPIYFRVLILIAQVCMMKLTTPSIR